MVARFGNKRLAIFIHFTKMLNMEALKSHDATKLQSFFDEFECHIRSLVALDMDESDFGMVFAPILLHKLPQHVQMDLHRRLGEDVWDLDRQRTVLREEIRLRKMSCWGSQEASTSKNDPVKPRMDGFRKPGRFNGGPAES